MTARRPPPFLPYRPAPVRETREAGHTQSPGRLSRPELPHKEHQAETEGDMAAGAARYGSRGGINLALISSGGDTARRRLRQSATDAAAK